MDEFSAHTMVNQQRGFFLSGQTLPIAFRKDQLKKLKMSIQAYENDIAEALHQDLGKPLKEASFDEIALTLKEIDVAIENLAAWARPKKVKTPFILQPARSFIYYEPYGTVLILAPWNYPFFLMMSPLIGAIAAGNCVLIKPSEIADKTQIVIAKLIQEAFRPHYIAVMTGGSDIAKKVLQERFDYIFFTGSAGIGKEVMTAAAQHLTPVTLELGGKSPCIIDESANLDYAARRIAWAKNMNAGQVCIAPDYLYIARSCKEAFIQKLIAALKQFFGEDPRQSASFGRIINDKHFTRLRELLRQGKIIYGGEVNETERYIAPTLMDNITWEDPIMQAEIFGPILPILTFDKIEEVINAIQMHDKPLSLYLFTQNKDVENLVLKHIAFGGGCINDCVLHIVNVNLPFGGVGQSGMGQYHGQYSFETFSHRKSIYSKHFAFEVGLEYPPYTETKLKWLKRLLRI